MDKEKIMTWIVSKNAPVFGWVCRGIMKIPMAGKVLGWSNRTMGKILPSLSFLGFRNEASYENAVWNWEVFLRLIGAAYRVDETSPFERIYTITKCPAGHCRLEHLPACRATMELDNSLVERSGARLIVDKRLPVDGVCVERIVAE
jgi:hypothetical protein